MSSGTIGGPETWTVAVPPLRLTCRDLPMGGKLERMRLEKAFRNPSPVAFRRYCGGRARAWWMGVGAVAGLSALVAQAVLGFDAFHVQVPVLGVLVAGGLSLIGFLTSRYATFSQSALKLSTEWQARIRKADGEAMAAIEDRGRADATRSDRKSVQDALIDAEAQAKHIRANDLDMVIAYNGASQAFLEYIQKVAPLVDDRFPNCAALYELWRSDEPSTSLGELRRTILETWNAGPGTSADNAPVLVKAIEAPVPGVVIDAISIPNETPVGVTRQG